MSERGAAVVAGYAPETGDARQAHDGARPGRVGPFSGPKVALVVGDTCTVVLAVLVSLAIEPAATGAQTARSWLVVVLTPILWMTSLARQRVYTARCIRRRLEEFRRILTASGGAVAAVAVVSYAVDVPLDRLWLATTALVTATALTVERELARSLFLKMRRSGRMRRPVVIVGANHEALELARMMERDPSIGYDAVGFVSDTLAGDPDGPPVLGRVAETLEIVRRTGAIGVLIATTAVTTRASNRLARSLTEEGIHVELSSTLRDVTVERLRISSMGPFPMLYVEAVRRGGWRAVAKRTFDIVVAASLLILTAPVLVVIALAVELTSRGGMLFRQQRVGRNGRCFDVLKFRTMVAGAEKQRAALEALNEADGPLFKIADDPRVTSVGRFLRKSSLDELPQLWNVLRGEMSLVGPRPALPEEAEVWSPELRERLRVKPGITGMWQVHGRSAASFDEYVRLDLFYVDNWSLIADVSILGRTIPAVFLRRGAY